MSEIKGLEPSEFDDEEDEKLPAVEPDLGDSVHPETKQSYNDLGMQPPDTVRLTTLRPQERMKRNMKEVGKPITEETKISNIYRLRDRRGKEWYHYTKLVTVYDMQGNKTAPNEYPVGAHEKIIGSKIKNANFEVVNTNVEKREQVLDHPWNPKDIQKLIKLHEKSGGIAEEIDLMVADASTHIRSVYMGKPWTIKNLEDFTTGKFEDLVLLAQRGLSTQEPSLSKLKQPISEDPEHSLAKKGLIR